MFGRWRSEPISFYSLHYPGDKSNASYLHDLRRRVLGRQHIEREFKKNIWVATKDTGVDLLGTNQKNTKTISLQVKFSKDFLSIMKLPELVLGGLR